MKTIRDIAILVLTVFSSVLHAGQMQKISLYKFFEPLCLIDNSTADMSFRQKLRTLKKQQKGISHRTSAFRKNLKLEKKGELAGSAKWLTNRHLQQRGYTAEEIDFAFFALTLFGEARGLSEQDMGMVARVINNRRGRSSYRQTVTRLAQFSTWYYKNKLDNVHMLCPDKNQSKSWHKAVAVAHKYYLAKDNYLTATHYFSPKNMVPRYKVPKWSRGKHVINYGGHLFLIDKRKYRGKKKVFYIPKNKVLISQNTYGI